MYISLNLKSNLFSNNNINIIITTSVHLYLEKIKSISNYLVNMVSTLDPLKNLATYKSLTNSQFHKAHRTSARQISFWDVKYLQTPWLQTIEESFWLLTNTRCHDSSVIPSPVDEPTRQMCPSFRSYTRVARNAPPNVGRSVEILERKCKKLSENSKEILTSIYYLSNYMQNELQLA